MKTAKKTIWLVLALLPIMTFLFMLLGQIGQQKAGVLGMEGVEVYPIWSSIYITEDISGMYTIANMEGNNEIITFTELALQTFVGLSPYVPKESIMGAFIGLYNIFSFDISIPASAPTFFGMLYLFYLALLELVSLVIDLVLFVPRKCAEIFR